MPFFQIQGKTLRLVKSTNFNVEKELQTLIDQNLDTTFNCRFVASEFSTGAEHAGRIDTLALSEDNNPVIIEYKKVESSELINQSLYYAAWIHDHKGDFQVTVNKALGADTHNKIILHLKLDPQEINPMPVNGRDVSNIGHYGTGDFELTIKNSADISSAKSYIEQAFRNVGG